MVETSYLVNARQQAKTIKKIREEKSLTQQQVAELVNMHRFNYSKVESGERDLSIEAISKVSKYFGMTIDHSS